MVLDSWCGGRVNLLPLLQRGHFVFHNLELRWRDGQVNPGLILAQNGVMARLNIWPQKRVGVLRKISSRRRNLSLEFR